ncbi:hypothetical protein TVAG_077850 [Trichomonas vaginalis G3]|uniref:F5/8 type C domain-containing protein n=1 Tax=Trichomonas vaginalis (strain ATCC PRA-98 / G3) TaxID=412133 RepID=A2FGL9_TRIV3|nr:galactose-binding domain-like family [Trichomonas vaginalis G3]EAX95943.1 hypothetical protein TVAG_077850 [Trichomonas vaginalis G3]KAI5492670.1 galactose-binding domain-like family [Trichomonas vaginalis G3]|eukprot:XP_001308873.1 hypothetical protein [Trichomonas vaginalis G3]
MLTLFSVNCLSLNSDGIFSKVYNSKIINIYASGSSKQYINGSRQITKPEYAIYPWDKTYDWCSNCAHTYFEHPYITFSLQSRKIKIKGYFIRSGCCYEEGCCCEDEFYHRCFDCCLYSWSLQISDDNVTWKDVHKVEKDKEMRLCKEKSYELDNTYTTTYVRIIQNAPCPGYPPCIAINKFDIFGEVVGEQVEEDFVSYHDDDEDDVSIIGHISRNNVKSE